MEFVSEGESGSTREYRSQPGTQQAGASQVKFSQSCPVLYRALKLKLWLWIPRSGNQSVILPAQTGPWEQPSSGVLGSPNLPWSPRQPLQTLNSTRAQACKGRLCTSTLTETLQLVTYFKNGNAVTGRSAQARARRWACPQSRSPHANGADFGAE